MSPLEVHDYFAGQCAGPDAASSDEPVPVTASCIPWPGKGRVYLCSADAQ